MALRSEKQKMFVQEYLVDLNASQAALRAGYSPKTAFRSGQENMQKPAIQAAIKKAMEARSKRTEISQDAVLNEYAKIAFLDPRKFFDTDGNLIPIHKLDDDTAAALAGMDILTKYVKNEDGEQEPEHVKKIKIADKIKALQDVGRHLGIFEKDNTQKTPKEIVISRRSRDK